MGKVYDYYPKHGHTSNEISATLRAWLKLMSPVERRKAIILARRYTEILPGLGQQGALEFIWRIKELLNDR